MRRHLAGQERYFCFFIPFFFFLLTENNFRTITDRYPKREKKICEKCKETDVQSLASKIRTSDDDVQSGYCLLQRQQTLQQRHCVKKIKVKLSGGESDKEMKLRGLNLFSSQHHMYPRRRAFFISSSSRVRNKKTKKENPEVSVLMWRCFALETRISHLSLDWLLSSVLCRILFFVYLRNGFRLRHLERTILRFAKRHAKQRPHVERLRPLTSPAECPLSSELSSLTTCACTRSAAHSFNRGCTKTKNKKGERNTHARSVACRTPPPLST